MTPNPWDCILTGNNLLFDFRFLVNKINKYQNAGITLEYFISRPHVDIKPIMIFANGGRFKGCHFVLNKSSNGALVPQWYKEKQYNSILNYIKEEAVAFCDFYHKAHKMICYNDNSRLDEYV